ncbi:MAG: hypothetical protein ACREF4_12340 [Gammaproteobacteria bacterium]
MTAACVLVLACGGADTADEAAVRPADAQAAPATIALEDVAGTWNVTAVMEMGDTTHSVLVATTEITGWTRTFTNRDPIEVRVVAVGGDSIVVEAGPYQSVVRPELQVTTLTVYRLQDGSLIGDGTSHFVTTGADSVMRTRSVGIRAN